MPDSNREELRSLMYSGKVWRGSEVATLLAGEADYIAIQTGDDEIVLEGFDIITSADDLSVTVYEGGSFTGGLLSQPLNVNRNAEAEQFPGIRKIGVTPVELGTPIYSRSIFTWQNIGANLNQGENTPVTILRDNTTYIFKLLNSSPQAGKISVESTYSKSAS